MNAAYFDAASVLDVIQLCWDDLHAFVTGSIASAAHRALVTAENLPASLTFDAFRWGLLQTLLALLLLNLLGIVLAWAYYGRGICERFMRLTTSSQAIEELRASVSRLKLPKEHTPRI